MYMYIIYTLFCNWFIYVTIFMLVTLKRNVALRLLNADIYNNRKI